ncbi:hypothetical protein SLS54_009803 [Diplodia seriata]
MDSATKEFSSLLLNDGLLTSSNAYQEFRNSVLEFIDTLIVVSKPFEDIRCTVTSNLKEAAKQYVIIWVKWELEEFCMYELGGQQSLEPVLTLSGSANEAYAGTCYDYVQRFWPVFGIRIVRQIVEMVQSSKQHPSQPPILNWFPLAVSGDVHNQIPSRVSMILAKSEECIIAEGFPIPSRETGRGLEMSFDIMVILGRILYPMEYLNGMVLKGRSTILVPISREGDSVQWHLLSSRNGTISMDDIPRGKVTALEHVNIDELSKLRTFVGFCENAYVLAGGIDSGFRTCKQSDIHLEPWRAKLSREMTPTVGTSGLGFFGGQLGAKILDKLPFVPLSSPAGEAAYQAVKAAGNPSLREASPGIEELKLTTLVTKLLRALRSRKEKVIERSDTNTDLPFLKGLKAPKLSGWELQDVASFEFYYRRKTVKLEAYDGNSWVSVVEENPDMVVLFCSGLNALIAPAPFGFADVTSPPEKLYATRIHKLGWLNMHYDSF